MFDFQGLAILHVNVRPARGLREQCSLQTEEHQNGHQESDHSLPGQKRRTWRHRNGHREQLLRLSSRISFLKPYTASLKQYKSPSPKVVRLFALGRAINSQHSARK